MNTLNALVWLFPVLYMIHDFEEIILIGAWKKRYKKEIEALKDKKAPYADFISTASFSCSVAVNFFIFSIVTLLSCLTNTYVVWYGLFFAIVFHFAIHIFISIRFKHFVPGLLTSILCLPVGTYILFITADMAKYSWLTICVSCVICFLILLADLVIIHALMPVFNKWLEKYAEKSSGHC